MEAVPGKLILKKWWMKIERNEGGRKDGGLYGNGSGRPPPPSE